MMSQSPLMGEGLVGLELPLVALRDSVVSTQGCQASGSRTHGHMRWRLGLLVGLHSGLGLVRSEAPMTHTWA